MRAARQAVSAGLACISVDGFPPVPCSADQVVTLTGKFHQLMTERQIAQAQQVWDGHGVGTGQAGLALPAEFWTKPLLALVTQVLHDAGFHGLQGAIALGE